MMTTMSCMRMVLTRVMFLGILGLAGFGGALSVPSAGFASETETNAAAAKDALPEATYDETQPGADDPRVKEGFAAYKAGDFKKAYDIWLPLAEAGNAEAQFRVGRLYSFGEGRDSNVVKAIRWYELAVLKGHILANYNIGLLYLHGERVEENFLKASIYLKYSAENGHTKSQRALGVLYAIASGKIQNIILAYKWLHIAMNNGDLEAADIISKLNEYATQAELESGLGLMREWFESHPRTQ